MSNKICPTHILKKTKSGKYRLCRVKTVIPSDSVKEIISCNSLNSGISASTVIRHIDDKSTEVVSKFNANSLLVLNELKSLRSYIEKSFIFVFVLLSLVVLLTIL